MKSYNFYAGLLTGQHTLIAGRTGSGKSVIENGLIYQILLTDPTAKLLLIDPKRVELYQYSSLVNCVGYADTTEAAAVLLQSALEEIERRYNAVRKTGRKSWTSSRLYIVIDELNDLLTTGKRDIYPLLLRIAQIGRAAGVVLICCTQSPKRDIIPSNLRCNFGQIVGLKTTTTQESKNIFDISGLENLPQYGSCIVLNQSGYTSYTNIPMVPDEAVQTVTSLYRPKKRKRFFGIF